MAEQPRSPVKLPPTAGMPLFPLSPERANARDNSSSPQHSRHIPQSPSLPDFDSKYDLRRVNLDVQGMVAKFNHLDIKDHAELRKRDKAALERAQMGREEAESELSRVKEESRKMKKDIDDNADRERKVVKRLDAVTEDLHRTKETSAHAQQLYEKEIRRARKEAFKASSTLVKLQEELKAARSSLNVSKADLDMERHKGGRREQEAFTAQYELVSVQEELTKTKERIKVVEDERDALKTNLKEEEVARVAAEGMIALPPASANHGGDDDEFGSPRKRRGPPVLASSRPMTPTMTPASRQPQTPSHHRIQLDTLRSELALQINARRAVELQIDFMKMECQFGCCSCRVAEHNGLQYVHDGSFAADIQALRPVVTEIDVPPAYEEMQVDRPALTARRASDSKTSSPQQQQQLQLLAPAVDPIFSPDSGTFRRISGSSMHTARQDEPSLPSEPSIRSLDPIKVVVGRPSIHRLKDGHEDNEENPFAQPNHPTGVDEEDFDDTRTPATSIPAAFSIVASPEPSIHDDADESEDPQDQDDEEDDDDDNDIFLDSPTTRIAATTSTVRIPLAPLSSPAKPPPSDQDDIFSPACSSYVDTPSTITTDDKENNAPRSLPPSTPKHPSQTFAAAADAWQTPLTRAEAIEKLRERRGRSRANTGGGSGTTTAATAAAAPAPAALTGAATPKRAVSHGQTLKTPATDRTGRDKTRRDISAPSIGRTPRTAGR